MDLVYREVTKFLFGLFVVLASGSFFSCSGESLREKLGLTSSRRTPSGLTVDQTRIIYAMEHMNTEQLKSITERVKSMGLSTQKEKDEQTAALIRKAKLYREWDGEEIHGPRIEPRRN